MTSPFAQMVDILFANEAIAADASYAAGRNTPVSVRVIRHTPQQVLSLYQTGVLVEGDVIDVRVAEVAQPAAGDIVTLNGEDFAVRGFEIDAERLVWRLNVDKQ